MHVDILDVASVSADLELRVGYLSEIRISGFGISRMREA